MDEAVRPVFAKAKEEMDHAVEATRGEFAAIRTSRASPALLDHVLVEAYSSRMAVKQLASIASPEPRMLLVSVWDPTLVPAMRKALATSDLGVNPQVEGNVIRIVLPTMTEERRKDLAKVVAKKTEAGKVAIRNIRRDALEAIRKLEKSGEISEDGRYRAQEELQKFTDDYIHKLDQLHSAKEAEIMEV